LSTAVEMITTDPAAGFSSETWTRSADLNELRAEEALNVELEGFAGPLDLMLALARTHKLDLSNISILAIAQQYLAFIAEAQRLRLEIAADYLVMAAWLAFLKSKLLLPRERIEEVGPTGEELAARLAFRLQRLEAMRRVAAQLMTRKRLGVDVFPRGMPEGMKTIRERQYTAEIFDLLRAYTEPRRRGIAHRAHVVKRRAVWSIKDARQRLEKLIGLSGESWVQLDMYLEQYLPSPDLERTALASSFGATLEMVREGLVELRQEGPFAPIYMRRRGEGGEWQDVRGWVRGRTCSVIGLECRRWTTRRKNRWCRRG
jgi:segregation and condensation protein A